MSAKIKERLAALREGKKNFWKDDAEAVLGIVMLLVLIGSVNVFSSSFVYAETNFGSPYIFLKKQGLNLLCGSVFLVAGLKVRYQVWRDRMGWIFLGLCAALVAVFIFGPVVNGAKRWLSFGLMSVQPAEFAKVVAVFIMASYVSERMRRGFHCQFLTKQMMFLAIIFVLIEREPDGATATACMMAPMMLLLLSNMPVSSKLGVVLTGIGGAILLVALQPYRLQRIMAMANPWAHAQGDGYQVVQSLSAIGSGGLTGMGLGMGISKYAYLPEAHTDFAFAIFSQENGFIGVCFVLALFAALLYYGLRIAHRTQDPLGKCLATGLTLLLVMQALANMFMVAGIGPVIGVPLPFISYGGSSLFASLFAVGIIMNIDRQRETAEKRRALERAMNQLPPEPPARPPAGYGTGRPSYLHRVK